MAWLWRWKRSRSLPPAGGISVKRRDSDQSTDEPPEREHDRDRDRGRGRHSRIFRSRSVPEVNRKQVPEASKPKPVEYVPTTPASIHEAYHDAASSEPSRESFMHEAGFSEDELKYLFSGAPHFLLERDLGLHWLPHYLFPWDESTGIQNLRDRKPLAHRAFALQTLHAHLPPYTEQTDVPSHPPDQPAPPRKSHRPIFDIGAFEVPNMLAATGKEAGCVGYRYFLEWPVADAFKQSPVTRSKFAHQKEFLRSWDIPINDPYSDCRPRTVLDRLKIVKEGPLAWKRLGVRYCSIKSMAKRIQTLAETRDEILSRAFGDRIVDTRDIPELYRQLFTEFLYDVPPDQRVESPTATESLRLQIDMLTRVLTVKGAWVDFSIEEWRLRAGQILWEIPPHQDGDCLNDVSEDVPFSAERRWLLMQCLLTTELLLRIDTAVALSVAKGGRDILELTPRDVHHIQNVRTERLQWSMVFCRRLLDGVSFRYQTQAPITHGGRQPASTRLRERLAIPTLAKKRIDESAWDCLTVARTPYRQLDALFYFAEFLDWPGVDVLKRRMKSYMDVAMSGPANMVKEFSSPLSTAPLPPGHKRLDRHNMYRQSRSTRLIQLQMPLDTQGDTELSFPCFRGWMSRSWMSALVLPGDAINSLLMATVLESDHEAMRALGPIANMYGGFVYKGRSFWSLMTVVARVLSCLEDHISCMGWTSSPLVPHDDNDDRGGKRCSDGWFDIKTRDDPTSMSMPRIYQGFRVFHESSPLGLGGEISPSAFVLPTDNPEAGHEDWDVEFTHFTLSPVKDAKQHANGQSTELFPRKVFAFASFRLTLNERLITVVTLPLKYNIHFISSFTCLPPPGRATQHEHGLELGLGSESRRSSLQHDQQYHPLFADRTNEGHDLVDAITNTDLLASRSTSTGSSDSRPQLYPPRRRCRRLPGHLLHRRSYPYSYIALSSLATMNQLPPISTPRPSPHARARDRPRHPPKHTFILDARGSKDKEAFARAWCASIGTNAVVGRVGRTCLACCIREARAVDVRVVIRVGALDMGRTRSA